jgi:hypothetical protein
MMKTGRVLAWATGIACVACCAAPLVWVAVGGTGLAGLVAYSERVAAGAAVLFIVVFVAWRLRRRTAPTCKIDGQCKPR